MIVLILKTSNFLFLKSTDQSANFYSQIQANMDDRRARQLLEEQVKVITAVCKKLNQDIEVFLI